MGTSSLRTLLIIDFFFFNSVSVLLFVKNGILPQLSIGDDGDKPNSMHICILPFNRKFQDYVYIKLEYWSTM